MPRSADGRWTANCSLCGKSFNQTKRTRLYCSQKCSNNIDKPGKVGPRIPKVQLTCPVCGEDYLAARSDKRACSRRCYAQLPDRQVAIRAADRRPERRARQNEQRRGSERVRAGNHRSQLRIRYGLTPEQFAEMLAKQGGVCAICGNPPTPGGVLSAARLHVDHDHVTKQVRDLLCLSCNNGLGRFRDDPVRLRAAAEYIERHRAAAVT